MSEKQIRLVACDMDGTLLNNAKELPEGFIPWVKSHPGVKVVIASGRQYETLRRDFEEVQDMLYFIADNGALVFHRGELLHIEEICMEPLLAALELVMGIEGVVPIVCGAASAYMMPSSPTALFNARMYYKKLEIVEDLAAAIKKDRPVKIACFIESCDIYEASRILEGLDHSLESVISGNEWIDIAKRGVNKGMGITAIQEKCGITGEESMAFGDYMNDIQLLEACAESYAMENSHPRVKAIAKHIAPSNEDKGVMEILNRNEARLFS